jgi:hypothetical protein
VATGDGIAEALNGGEGGEWLANRVGRAVKQRGGARMRRAGVYGIAEMLMPPVALVVAARSGGDETVSRHGTGDRFPSATLGTGAARERTLAARDDGGWCSLLRGAACCG